jgi:hypothetical protein
MEERHKRIREELEKLVKKKNIKMKNRIAKLSEDLDDVDYITQGIGEKKEKMLDEIEEYVKGINVAYKLYCRAYGLEYHKIKSEVKVN